NHLKMLACLFMLCDHVGLVLLDNNLIARSIGRLAFPIFAFLLVEGMKHTSNMKKYILRLIAFAVISEVPDDLAIYGTPFYIGHQNVFFTLALGLFVIYCFESSGVLHKWAYGILAAAMAVALVLRFDYNMAGILIIFSFYMLSPLSGGNDAAKRIKTNIELSAVTAFIDVMFLGTRQLYSLFALLPINLYNGKRGRKGFKYVFYLFYPLHLLILWGIKAYVIDF
ncbi:MAG: TraX family protein, partial [Coprococcus sp.]